MSLIQAIEYGRVILEQTGFAPRIVRAQRFEAHDPDGVERARRRRRRRFALVVLAVAVTGAVADVAPPRHGAMLVVMPPWINAAEAERRIAEAGGVALSAEDGDVALFGVRLARMAIGVEPAFADAARAQGAFVLDAAPILWLDETLARLAGRFSRA